MKIQLKGLHCPKCKAPEYRRPDQAHPGMLNIRGFKVEIDGYWWSQCLVCAGYYGRGNNADVVPSPMYKENKGWF